MSQSPLQQVFRLLNHRCPVTLTNAFSVDDGFTEDFPIIVGRNSSAAFWLYDDGGEFVFSYEVPGTSYHNHGHPQSVEEAVAAVVDFMNLPAGPERSSP